MSNQGLVQQSVRDSTGTALNYNGDWHALFDAGGIAAGSFNGRLLAWINTTLGTSYPDLPGAMQAFAVDQGYTNWSSMGTITLTGGGPGGALDALLLEDGTSGLMLEDGTSYILMEA